MTVGGHVLFFLCVVCVIAWLFVPFWRAVG